MSKKLLAIIFILGVHVFSASSFASHVGYLKEHIESETKKISEMVDAGDNEGLIKVLSEGIFPARVIVAEHFGETGYRPALPALQEQNKLHGGWKWWGMSTADRRNGVFAVAICKILNQDESDNEKVEALFELLDGRGPAVAKLKSPNPNRQNSTLKTHVLKRNHDVGTRVAAELDKYVTADIIKRLRKSINSGAAQAAVWMEVRDMEVEDGIARCMQIARDEEEAQSRGAIMTLEKYEEDAIEALDTLATEGYWYTISVLRIMNDNPKVFDILCKHLLSNKNTYLRIRAASWVAYVKSEELKLKSLQTLFKALYDPSDSVRSTVASSMNNRAYKSNKLYFDQVKDSLFVAALTHPDEVVRKELTEAVTRLEYELPKEWTGHVPEIRTDLSTDYVKPKNARERLEEMTKPLEEMGVKLLKTGPAEEAVEVYRKLRILKPEHEPYEKGLTKADGYVKAAKETADIWYEDAPYIGYKGRYSYYLANVDDDMGDLKEKFDLARELNTTAFPNWKRNPFKPEPKTADQFLKALQLYQHIVDNYPKNEYIVLMSKGSVAGLKLNLYKEMEEYVKTYVDFFTLDIKDIVDSTDQRRNKPVADDLTQAMLDFERVFKSRSRKRVIEICTSHAGYLKEDGEDYNRLYDEIIDKCQNTDSQLAEMAKEAKAKFNKQN